MGSIYHFFYEGPIYTKLQLQPTNIVENCYLVTISVKLTEYKTVTITNEFEWQELPSWLFIF